jgi:hypothetical protein
MKTSNHLNPKRPTGKRNPVGSSDVLGGKIVILESNSANLRLLFFRLQTNAILAA